VDHWGFTFYPVVHSDINSVRQEVILNGEMHVRIYLRSSDLLLDSMRCKGGLTTDHEAFNVYYILKPSTYDIDHLTVQDNLSARSPPSRRKGVHVNLVSNKAQMSYIALK